MRYRRATYRFAVVASSTQPLATQPLPFGILDGSVTRLATRHWRPAADIYESPEAFTITIDLAGIDPDDIDIVVLDDGLIVEGRRHLEPPAQRGFYHEAQIRQGPFRLELMLPARVDVEHVKARSERGLLVLTLRRLTEERDGR
jgi:HSP20 family protein